MTSRIKHCSHCGHAVQYQIPAGDNRERAVCGNCNHIHYENPRVVVGALCMYDNKILMCKRDIEPRRGFWTLPAGFLEKGETTAEGAAREAFEEACAKIEIIDLFAVFNIPHVDQVQMMYLAKLIDGQYGVGEESCAVELCTITEALQKDIAFPTIRATLEKALSLEPHWQASNILQHDF